VGRPKQFDPDIAVERAMDVFWRKGYASTTPQDLVEALGIGKGSLYNTFGSKHALFELALQRYVESQTEPMLQLLNEPGPVKQRLRAALRLVADSTIADPDRRGCLAVNTAAVPGGADATALVQRVFDRAETAFQATIEEGLRSGEIDASQDARALGSLLLTTVVGMQLMSKTNDGPDRLQRVIDAVLAQL
jgi:TetR/AcrR family transcriptional repressor of nem operon